MQEDIAQENMTLPGSLVVRPNEVFIGSSQDITVFYLIHEDFNDGTVVFHLPTGIVATPYNDKVIIADSTGDITNENARVFTLEPSHIANNGQEVRLTGITLEQFATVTLVLTEKTIVGQYYLVFEVTADADGAGETKVPVSDEEALYVVITLKDRRQNRGYLSISLMSFQAGTTQTLTLTYTLKGNYNEGWISYIITVPVVPGQDKVVINGVERVLSETDLEVLELGTIVNLTGITAEKGDTKVSMGYVIKAGIL